MKRKRRTSAAAAVFYLACSHTWCMPNNLPMHVESDGSSNLYEQRRRINECARVCFSRDLMQIASAEERLKKRGEATGSEWTLSHRRPLEFPLAIKELKWPLKSLLNCTAFHADWNSTEIYCMVSKIYFSQTYIMCVRIFWTRAIYALREWKEICRIKEGNPFYYS